MNHVTDALAIPADRAAALARDLFGVDAVTLSPLPSERDANVKIEGPQGAFILKLAHPDEPRESIAFQNALLAHLAAFAPDLPTPRLAPLRDGDGATGWIAAADGRPQAVRLVRWLDGAPLATVTPTEATWRALGAALGRLDHALQSFGHPGAHRAFDWEIRETPRARARLGHVVDADRRALLARALDRYDATVAPRLPRLRHGVIHNDANDWNVLIDPADVGCVAGLIDVGDAVFSPLAAELAVACAYAMLDRADPLLVAAQLVAGYHAELPLADDDFAVLPGLIAARLAISVSKSAERAEEAKDNPYLLVSEAPAWALLERLERIDAQLATGVLRKACGLPASPRAPAVTAWLKANRARLAPLTRPDLARAKKILLPLSDPADPLTRASAAGDWDGAAQAYADLERTRDFEIGIGGWGVGRCVYQAPFFASKMIEGARRAAHLGLDVFAPAGTPLFAPLEGTVVVATINPAPQDYGGVIVLEHEPEPGLRFRSLWGHLAHESVRALKIGDRVAQGGLVARLGDYPENGGWAPHLHLQLLLTDDAAPQDAIGVGEAALIEVWADLFPPAYDFAGLPPETFGDGGRTKAEALAARRAHLPKNLSLSYREPLKILRGDDVWLIDETGRAYLDAYNNVAHVGHSHPRVVAALADQAGRLNTNTRYLSDAILDYAERLKAILPRELDTLFFCCSGSEANELALRLTRAWSGRRDTLVLDWAYHGTTQGLIDVSPYKYKRKGGTGRPATTHEIALPEPYRRPDGESEAAFGLRRAQEIARHVAALAKIGQAPGAFIAETIPSVAGQVFLPPHVLRGAAEAVRGVGGLYVADEVQVGFGRVGRSFWAFEEHGVIPDVVTMGKPIGNGHPMAAVATRREIADRFANGMEFFNTFGGNPVSCRVGLAVLDALADQDLLANATRQGERLLAGFHRMQERWDEIGDVRGRGLFLGIEMVTDRVSKAHATRIAGDVVQEARRRGVLAGTDGPLDNVIKLRPAMTLADDHVALLLETFEASFAAVLG